MSDQIFCPHCLGMGFAIGEGEPCHAGPYYNGGFSGGILNGEVIILSDHDSPHKTREGAAVALAQKFFDALMTVSHGALLPEDVYNLVHPKEGE